ncbi:hypothetical protein C8Q79DRAFT_642675 [Trametes meyenii]|nr:hypothetical protein C8Q79DRAFT_642675 [Trametes meyenii]
MSIPPPDATPQRPCDGSIHPWIRTSTTHIRRRHPPPSLREIPRLPRFVTRQPPRSRKHTLARPGRARARLYVLPSARPRPGASRKSSHGTPSPRRVAVACLRVPQLLSPTTSPDADHPDPGLCPPAPRRDPPLPDEMVVRHFCARNGTGNAPLIPHERCFQSCTMLLRCPQAPSIRLLPTTSSRSDPSIVSTNIFRCPLLLTTTANFP